jgi:hypothetical protein
LDTTICRQEQVDNPYELISETLDGLVVVQTGVRVMLVVGDPVNRLPNKCRVH